MSDNIPPSNPGQDCWQNLTEQAYTDTELTIILRFPKGILV